MERKVHCLVTAGKGVQGVHQCHLEQGFPLSYNTSPCFSVGIWFLLPTIRLLKACSSGGRTLSAGSTQSSANPTATFSFRRGRGSHCPSCSELQGTTMAEPHLPSSAEQNSALVNIFCCRMRSTSLHHGVNFLSRLQSLAVAVTVCGEATDGSHTFAPGSASPVAGSSLADPPSWGLNCYYELNLWGYIDAILCTKKQEDILHWENIL